MTSKRPSYQSGVSILEVLISIAVVSIGMLAMVKMQGQIMKGSSFSNMRSMATSLVQEKLDDLRAFECLAASTPSPSTACPSYNATSHAYPSYFHDYDTTTDDKAIAADNGGSRNQTTGNLNLPASDALLIGNFSFSRHWVVTNNWNCTPSAACRYPYFKTATVIVTWGTAITSSDLTTDANSDGVLDICVRDDVVCLSGTIAGVDPYSLANNTANVVSNLTPRVGYVPIGVPDSVPVSIDLGKNIKKETSKPLPDVSSKGYSLKTTFDTVTYKDVTGSVEEKTATESYTTLSCTCDFTTDGNAYPASYFYWDTDEKRLKVKYRFANEMVSKARGTAPSINGDTQDPLCEDCCRDHHDKKSDTTTALYDPARPDGVNATADDYTAGGDHKHYYYSDPTNPQSGLVAVTSGRYLESCRFLRVDGFWRLMQDWRLVDVTVMPKNGYLSDATTLASYQDYVANVVKARVKTDGGTTTALPSKSTLSTRDINRTAGSPDQLLARAIYVDEVYQKNSPRSLDTSNYYTPVLTRIAANDPTNQPWLDRVSFNEVNLSLLASWKSSDTSIATVSNDTILDITSTVTDYYGVYSRGRSLVQSGTGGNTNVTAYVLPSNSGLTGGSKRATYTGTVDYTASSLAQSGTIGYPSEIGIDPHDHASSLRKSDYLTITRTGTGSTHTVTGTLKQGNSSASFTETAISVSGSGGISCTDSITGTTGTFSCTVSDGYSGTFTITSSQSTNFFDMATNSDGSGGYSSTCSVSNVTTSVVCGNFWVYGPSMQVSGICTGNRCSHNSLSLTATGTGATCTKGTSPYCTVPLDATTHQWSGSISMSGVNRMDIELSPSTASCPGDKTSASFTALGPADKPGAFDMCATN